MESLEDNVKLKNLIANSDFPEVNGRNTDLIMNHQGINILN